MNENNHQTYFTHPSKKILTICSLIWFVGLSLNILAMTDLFRESLLQIKYIFMHFSLIGSTAMTLFLWYNYFKNKNEKPPIR